MLSLNLTILPQTQHAGWRVREVDDTTGEGCACSVLRGLCASWRPRPVTCNTPAATTVCSLCHMVRCICSAFSVKLCPSFSSGRGIQICMCSNGARPNSILRTQLLVLVVPCQTYAGASLLCRSNCVGMNNCCKGSCSPAFFAVDGCRCSPTVP